MKKFMKKIPAFVIVSLIVLITVALAVFAGNLSYDYNEDGDINLVDVEIFMNTLVGRDNKEIGDITGDNKINILDVIALQNEIRNGGVQTYDGWTKGIY